MWRVLNEITGHPVYIGVTAGLISGWLLSWIYFRQRIWVMQQRLWDYTERRTAMHSLEDKRFVCPVCRSHSLHRSNKRSPGVFVGMLFGRAPYRCERCFHVSLQRARSLYSHAKRIDTYQELAVERKQFNAELQVARKMKRLYPEMFQPRAPLGRSEPPR